MIRDAGTLRVSEATLVSVIIPAFNAQSTLAATVQSVLDQTHTTLEIFIVDDGSRDNTAEHASRLASRDKRVRVIQQENGGVARARNAALTIASGEFVTWIDADDLWHPRKIERQLQVFRAAHQQISLVYTGYRLIDPADRILPSLRPLSDVSGFTLCQQIATNFFSNVSSIMVPIQLAQHFGGHDPRLRAEGIEGAEDLLLQLRLAAIGPVGCCREALVGYRMHDANMSLGHARAARSNLRAIDLIAGEHPEVAEWVLRLGRARIVGYAGYCLAKGDVANAISLVFRLGRQQTAETVLIMRRIIGLALRRALSANQNPDPEIGELFTRADPKTAPWRGHMLLSGAEKAKLEMVDAEIGARCATSLERTLSLAERERAPLQ